MDRHQSVVAIVSRLSAVERKYAAKVHLSTMRSNKDNRSLRWQQNAQGVDARRSPTAVPPLFRIVAREMGFVFDNSQVG